MAKIKYRIVEKGGLYHPQYKRWLCWNDIGYGFFTGDGLWVYGNYGRGSFKEAKEAIENHKARQIMKKPVIHLID
jgi:hypothetical protein